MSASPIINVHLECEDSNMWPYTEEELIIINQGTKK